MSDSANGQYDHPPFSMSEAIASTGAPGSAGASAAGSGAPIGSPVVSVPFTSSQVPEDMPRFDVHSGDTGVPGQLNEGISGLGPDFTAATGAGLGSANHSPHPAQGAGGA